MLIEEIKKQILESMKAKDDIRLSTLKMLSSALTNAEIDKKREKLTEEEEIRVVKSEAKKRKDAIELYEKGGDKERVEDETKELEILKEFMPEEMSDDDLEKIVKEVVDQSGASSMADMGKVMGACMGKLGGSVDGNRVSSMVKKLLSA